MSTPYEAFVSKWGGVRMSQWQDPYQRYRQPMIQGQAHYQDPRARPYMPTYRYVMPSPQIPQATDDEDSGDDDEKHVSFVDESVQGGDALDTLMTSAIPVENSATAVVGDKKAENGDDGKVETSEDKKAESAPQPISEPLQEVIADTKSNSTPVAAPEIVTEVKMAEVEAIVQDTKPEDAEEAPNVDATPAAEQSANIEEDPTANIIPESTDKVDDTAEPASDAIVVKVDEIDAPALPETDAVIAEPIPTSEDVEPISEPVLEQFDQPSHIAEKAVEPSPVDAVIEETPVADPIQEDLNSIVDIPIAAEVPDADSTPVADISPPPPPIDLVFDDIPPPPPPTAEQMLSIDVSTPAPSQEPDPETPIVDNASIAGSLDSEDKHVSFAPGTPEPKPTKRKKKTKDVKKAKRRSSVTDAEGIPANLAISNANLDVIPVPPPAPEVAALPTVAESKNEAAAETPAKPASEVKAKSADQKKPSSKAKAAKTGGLLAGAFFMAKASKTKSKSAKNKDNKKEPKTEPSTKAVAAETEAKTETVPAGLGIELAGDENTVKDAELADIPAAAPDSEVVAVPENEIVVEADSAGAEIAEPEVVIVPEKQIEGSKGSDIVVVPTPISADVPAAESAKESAKEPEIAESTQPDGNNVPDDNLAAAESTMPEGEDQSSQETSEASADAGKVTIVEVEQSETAPEAKIEAKVDESKTKELVDEHVEVTSADVLCAEIVDSGLPSQDGLNKEVTEIEVVDASQSDHAVSPVDSGVVLHEANGDPNDAVEESKKEPEALPDTSKEDDAGNGKTPAGDDEVVVAAETQEHQIAEEQVDASETSATADAQPDEPDMAKVDDVAVNTEQPRVLEETTVSSNENKIVANPSEEMSKEFEPTALTEDAQPVVDEIIADQIDAAEAHSKEPEQEVDIDPKNVVPEASVDMKNLEDEPKSAGLIDLADDPTEASIEDVVIVEESKNDGSVEVTVVDPTTTVGEDTPNLDASESTATSTQDAKVDEQLDKTVEKNTDASNASDKPADHEVQHVDVASELPDSSDESKPLEEKSPSTSAADAVSANVELPSTTLDASPACTQETLAKVEAIEAPSTQDIFSVEASPEQEEANDDKAVEDKPDAAVVSEQIEADITADEKPNTAATPDQIEVKPEHVTEERLPATAILDFAQEGVSNDASSPQPPSPTASRSSRSRKAYESSSRSHRKTASKDDPSRASHRSDKDRAVRSEDRRRRRSSVIQDDAVAKERRRDIRRTRDRTSFVEEDDDELRRLKREARRAERRVAEAEEQARLAREAHEAAELKRKELQKIAEEKKRPSTRDSTSKRDDTISSRAVKSSSKSIPPLSVRTDLDDRDKRTRDDERAKRAKDDDRSRRSKDDDRSRRSKEDDRSKRSKESKSDSRSQRKEIARDDKRSPEAVSPTASRIASSETSSRRHRRRSDAVDSRRGKERSERGGSRKVVDRNDRPRTEPKRQGILGSLFGR